MFLMVDLARYVRVSGAIQESLAVAMRCIVPTEGDCSSPGISNTSPELVDWYGYPNEPSRSFTYIQEVNYEPTVSETSWEAPLTGYEIPEFAVSANWDVYEIPVRRFVARLNSWSDTWAPVNQVWFVYDGSGELVEKFSSRPVSYTHLTLPTICSV